MTQVSKSAFSQARQGLSETAFVELNQYVVSAFYRNYSDLWTWNGLRLCAIDGSRLRLPTTSDIVENFGVHHSRPPNIDCPMALASVFYDVFNGIVIDAQLDRSNASGNGIGVRSRIVAFGDSSAKFAPWPDHFELSSRGRFIRKPSGSGLALLHLPASRLVFPNGQTTSN